MISAARMDNVLNVRANGEPVRHMDDRGEGVEIRPELRWHLFYALRRKLIFDGHLTDAMVDDHISADLGL